MIRSQSVRFRRIGVGLVFNMFNPSSPFMFTYLTPPYPPPPPLWPDIPANTKHLYKICTMLNHDVVQMLYNCFVFAGIPLDLVDINGVKPDSAPTGPLDAQCKSEYHRIVRSYIANMSVVFRSAENKPLGSVWHSPECRHVVPPIDTDCHWRMDQLFCCHIHGSAEVTCQQPQQPPRVPRGIQPANT